MNYSVSPSEYFDDYANEYKEEPDVNERLKLWLEHVDTFNTLIRACPFPISKEAEDWINNALIDI